MDAPTRKLVFATAIILALVFSLPLIQRQGPHSPASPPVPQVVAEPPTAQPAVQPITPPIVEPKAPPLPPPPVQTIAPTPPPTKVRPRASSPPPPPNPTPVQAAPTFSSGVIENAYRNNATSVPVMESGTVSRILPDDNQGSRHQRFIVSLGSGHTVLIAHNIDIAPRINNIREGDRVSFSGLYEWNEKGGVVHWTHHDPSGRYGGGYLQHNGMTYQ